MSLKPARNKQTVLGAQARGFSLVELLVVIAIISTLSAIILVSFNQIRAHSRDARRLADLSELQTALQIYHNEKHAYPAASSWRGNCSSWGGYGTTGSNGWIPDLAPTYIPQLPLDPKPKGTQYCYLYHSFNNNQDYMLLAYGTVETYTPGNNPKPRPAYPSQADFALYTDGAANQ